MNKKLSYPFEEDLQESLKDPKFRKIWEEGETNYQLGRQMIEKRLKKKISQRQLAKKVGTTQALISRIETMNANPSLNLLKRIAAALGSSVKIEFR